MAGEGETVRLTGIRGGRRLQRRLADMGLNPDVVFTVFRNSGCAIILDVRGSRLAIGRGMARRIMVRKE
jgi:Fe2+ transport system protein FeoA